MDKDKTAARLEAAARHAIALLRRSDGRSVISTHEALAIVRASVPTADLDDAQLADKIARVAIRDGIAVELD
jgi:hypothetical protein